MLGELAEESDMTVVDLTEADLDELALAGGPIAERLFQLDVAIQLELEVDWRDVDLRLPEEPEVRQLQGREIVRAALRRLVPG